MNLFIGMVGDNIKLFNILLTGSKFKQHIKTSEFQVYHNETFVPSSYWDKYESFNYLLENKKENGIIVTEDEGICLIDVKGESIFFADGRKEHKVLFFSNNKDILNRLKDKIDSFFSYSKNSILILKSVRDFKVHFACCNELDDCGEFGYGGDWWK